MIIASELKTGMALRLEGQVFKVLHSEFKAGGGQTGGQIGTPERPQNVDFS